MSYLDAIAIPDKTYFKIGEVAKLLDLEPYVLRYWESEFDVLDPDKTDSGQRVYQRDDIELVCQIRDLLYNEMFTIAGARRQLELERDGKPCLASLDQEAGSEHASSSDQSGADQSEADQSEADEAQPDLWEERLASQSAQIDQLEGELAEARQTAAHLQDQLQDQREQTSSDAGGLDPRLVSGLRDHIEGLARLAQRPV
jgi:DNA-binding transcriptional MerR regulator